MPYEWSKNSGATTLSAWPNRSLPKKGFVHFIAITALMISLPLWAVIGSPVLWGLLPFLVITVAGLWMAIQSNYKNGHLLELMTLTSDTVRLVRHNPKGSQQEWSANPHWVRVTLHPEDGPVENYLTLTGGGREVELGAFLSPDERKALYHDLNTQLRR